MKPVLRRRLLLAVGGTAANTFVAGCLDGPPGPAGGDGTDGTSRPPDEELPTECPKYDRDERVVCYDAVDPETVDGYLEPSTRSVGPGEPVEFTLLNRSKRSLATNFYNWKVHKHVDDQWYHVAPRMWNSPLMGVEPGGEHTWTIAIENDGIEAGDHVPAANGTEEIALRGLGGGHYAFSGRGWFEGESHEEATAFAATFEFDAEPLVLTPTDAIEETEWNGDTLVARSSRGDPDDEYDRLGAFEVERVDAPDEEPRRLVTEQVVRQDQLRDAIALAREHEADRVRLEEYDGTTPIFGARSDGVVEYQGAHYEVTTRELEDGEQD